MKTPLKAVILDDLPISVEALTDFLREGHPEIEVLGAFEKANDALLCITEKNANLLFLDIEMPDMDGFQFFELLRKLTIPLQCVIVTAHLPSYALSLLDNELMLYLEKPVINAELSQVIEKVKKRINEGRFSNRLLREGIETIKKKIALNTVKGILYIFPEEMIYAKADRKCTNVWIKDIGATKVMKGITDLFQLLDDPSIFKPDKSWLINLNYLKEIHEHSDKIILNSESGKSYEIGITHEGLANLKRHIKKT